MLTGDCMISNWHCNQRINPYGEFYNDGISVNPYEVMFVKVKAHQLDLGAPPRPWHCCCGDSVRWVCVSGPIEGINRCTELMSRPTFGFLPRMVGRQSGAQVHTLARGRCNAGHQ